MRSQGKRIAGASLLALTLTVALLAPEARAGIGQVFAVIRQVFGAPVGVSGTPTDGQVLTYSSSTGKWAAADAAGALSGVTEDGGSPNVVTVADALNVGTATDATAAGDFAAGLDGAARAVFDQSLGALDVYDNSTLKVRVRPLSDASVRLASDIDFQWSSTVSAGGTIDLSLARSAAGRIGVSDPSGSAGARLDLLDSGGTVRAGVYETFQRLGLDGTTGIYFAVGAVNTMILDASALEPANAGGIALGDAARPWGALTLGDGTNQVTLDHTTANGRLYVRDPNTGAAASILLANAAATNWVTLQQAGQGRIAISDPQNAAGGRIDLLDSGGAADASIYESSGLLRLDGASGVMVGVAGAGVNWQFDTSGALRPWTAGSGSLGTTAQPVASLTLGDGTAQVELGHDGATDGLLTIEDPNGVAESTLAFKDASGNSYGRISTDGFGTLNFYANNNGGSFRFYCDNDGTGADDYEWVISNVAIYPAQTVSSVSVGTLTRPIDTYYVGDGTNAITALATDGATDGKLVLSDPNSATGAQLVLTDAAGNEDVSLSETSGAASLSAPAGVFLQYNGSNRLYARTDGVQVQTNLRPFSAGGASLGSTAAEWGDFYTSGTIYLGAGQEARILTGTGTPEGAVTAPVGALFIRSDGGASTVLYVKESSTGNTGWVAYGAPGGAEVVESTNDGRLSVHSTDPLGEGSSSSILYLHRYTGSRMALYDGSSEWSYLTIAATPLQIATTGVATASRPYDVFAYDNSGTIAMELTAWTNATTRATALTRQDGVLVRSGATTRRYLGTVYLDASKQCTFNSSVRGVWNEANRVRWQSIGQESTNSWTYTTAAFRKWNNADTSTVSIMLGRSVDGVEAAASIVCSNSGGSVDCAVGIGIDDGTTNVAQAFGGRTEGSVSARYAGRPSEGYRSVIPEEYSAATGTTTWYGDGNVTYWQAGLVVTSWH